MSLTITQRPSVTYLGKTCKWNSVGNPILYKATRKDFTFNQINNSGGKVQLQFNGVDIVQDFIDPHGAQSIKIYVKSDNGVYDFTDDVVATDVTFSGGNTLVKMFSAAYVSAAPGGYTNYASTYRLGYKVDVEVWKDEAVDTRLATYEFTPDSKGNVTMNIASALRAGINKENLTDYTTAGALGETDSAFCHFYIKYREVWASEAAPAYTSDIANIYKAVHGARQITSPNGGNLAEYTTHVDTAYPAKFLTKLAKLSIWKKFKDGFSNPGYHNSVSLIVNDDVTANTQLVADSYRADGTLVASNQALSTSTNNAGKLVRYLFRTDNFSTDIVKLIIRLITAGSIRAMTNSSFVGSLSPWTNSAPLGTTWTHVPSFTIEGKIYTDMAQCAGLEEASSRLQNTTMAALTNGVRYQVTLNFYIFDDGGVQVSAFLGAQELNFGTFMKAGFYTERRTIVSSSTTGTFGVSVYFTADTTIMLFDVKVSSEIIYTEDKEVIIKEAACNQKHIYFRNSLGGDTFWNFDFNQMMEYVDASYNRKAKELALFDDQLTEDDWEALNDVITFGNSYAVAIPELLSTTNLTKKRVDQQVYLFDADGNKVGVIAIPTKNKTQTKQVRHKFEVAIELPETFL